MPAAVTSSSTPRTFNKAVTHKPRSQGQIKKTRVVRRRGRVQDDIGSDDEIEREVGTDSESEDERSSLDSDSDSDTEPASEDVVPNGHFTPSTSQSPGDRGVLNKESVAHLAPEAAPFFNPTGAWSEMVADETINGPAELPVIEFADFNGQVGLQNGSRSRKPKKTVRTTHPIPESANSHTPPQPLPADSEVLEADPVASTSRRSSSASFVRRPPGQTARQAYQQRLESDPSYVPTVGGFWGHDDRLLDKDLRSLSGWWRGRWQGRGHTRGFMRGGGRGGYFPPHASQPNPGAEDSVSTNTEGIPPIERAWTHDGFEEMRQREDQRRATEQAPRQPQASQPPRGINGLRGRGLGPLRGGRGGFGRGSYTPSPTRSRVHSPFLNSGRVWFAMKPELMWTKQHEGFLYFDSALKSRQNQALGLRVRLPGSQALVIKAPPRSHEPTSFASASPSSVSGSDVSDRTYTVRLPKRAGKERRTEPMTTKGATPPEVFTVKFPLLEPPAVNHVASSVPQPGKFYDVPPQQGDPSSSQPEESQSQLKQLLPEPHSLDPVRSAKTEEAVLKNPSSEVQAEGQQAESLEEEQRPSLPTIQTEFTPPLPQPSPAYGSPYVYPPALPPGVAINQHGMTYELASGRPVYLHAPAPMYNPRPVMHSHLTPPAMPFAPGHMHHHSGVSPDFLAQSTPHTPPVNGFIDPSTGTPIFSFPRQTSRIEIRAPSENAEPKSPGKSSSQSSALRTSAAIFEPSRSADNPVNGFFSSYPTPSYVSVNGAEGSPSGDEGHGSQQHMADPTMIGYPHYTQPYYYPEAYGYVPYMDMSQQAGQYEMYPPADSLPPQGTVYY